MAKEQHSRVNLPSWESRDQYRQARRGTLGQWQYQSHWLHWQIELGSMLGVMLAFLLGCFVTFILMCFSKWVIC
ncbi:hypothetical protein GBAR_LOCUS2677 [Geodia barretti]|uniref:Uncharacterized protein n=1 Tax=Geodia barretti TaxID=519541 RepID=A0AA35R1M9_GEOBA|nr:hypothetical protein GBAR_LOCUS2677 [Geodia barretti]